MANGAAKPIAKIKPGDVIAAAVPGVVLGTADRAKTVTAVHVTTTDHDYTDVTIATATGPQTIHGTSHHLYWNATTYTWTPANQLHAGEDLQTTEGHAVTITALRANKATNTTYNLVIDDLHTYYVEAGSTPVLVHNCPAGGLTRTVQELSEARPIHGLNENQSAPLRALEDSELLKAVNSPADGEYITLRTTDNAIMQGHHRVGELMRRAGDRNYSIEWDTQVRISTYTPDNSMFWDME
jgi:hypothetical protein